VGDTHILQYIRAILCVYRIILPVSIKHVKIYKLVELLLFLYTVAVPFVLYKSSITADNVPLCIVVWWSHEAAFYCIYTDITKVTYNISASFEN
jgi:hypothetical protein